MNKNILIIASLFLFTAQSHAGINIQISNMEDLKQIKNTYCIYGQDFFEDGSRKRHDDGKIYVCKSRIGTLSGGQSRRYWTEDK